MTENLKNRRISKSARRRYGPKNPRNKCEVCIANTGCKEQIEYLQKTLELGDTSTKREGMFIVHTPYLRGDKVND